MAERWASARRVYERAENAARLPLRKLCFEGPEDELRRTENLQPCVVATSLAALAAALEEAGLPAARELDLWEVPVSPDFLAGHSVGEYSALAGSGAIPFEACMEIVTLRGGLMARAARSRPGSMLALLGGTLEGAERLCADLRSTIAGSYVGVANVNSPEQFVIAGDLQSVAQAADRSAGYGFRRALPIAVAGAFHSVAMLPAAEELGRRLLASEIREPLIPVVGNMDALPLGGTAAVRAELSGQVAAPVRWADSIAYMISRGVDRFVEVGPGEVLTRLIRRSAPDVEATAAGDAAGVAELARLLGGG